MSTVEDDTTTELESVNEMLAEDEQRRARRADKAPAGFDPAMVFLLSQSWENLFEPTPKPYQVRCKGCGRTVVLWNGRPHFDRHKKALARWSAAASNKEGRVSKRGPKEEQARKLREERAESVVQPPEEVGEGGPQAVEPEAVRTAESASEAKPVKAKPAAKTEKAVKSNVESKALLAELVKRTTVKLKGLETKENEKVGYTSFKVGGKLIGYGWLTNKAELRVEAAITPSDIDADERVKPYKRSKDIAAATRIDGSKATYDLAVKMLVAAQKKQAAR